MQKTCTHCNREHDTPLRQCAHCTERSRRAVRRYSAKCRAEGRCPGCGSGREDDKYVHCEGCRRRFNHMERLKYIVPNTVIRRCIQAARRRALKRGLAYEPGLSYLEHDYPLSCEVCNATFDFATKSGKCGNAPSLDRVDNAEGYTVANTRMICWQCNVAKRDSSLEQLEQLVAYMRRTIR